MKLEKEIALKRKLRGLKGIHLKTEGSPSKLWSESQTKEQGLEPTTQRDGGQEPMRDNVMILLYSGIPGYIPVQGQGKGMGESRF